ncbi:hypothetical protein XENOCAPTIV_023287, partial [Xenoophorus captivus]
MLVVSLPVAVEKVDKYFSIIGGHFFRSSSRTLKGKGDVMIPALQLYLDCADYSLPSPALGCSYLNSCSSPAQCEIV